MGLEALLDQHVPTRDRRNAVAHAQALGVLLRSIIVEREPIYRQQETAVGFAPELFGLAAAQMGQLGDDRSGRALDRLFDADRAALLTAVVLAVGQQFAVRFDELHNDSTSVAFCGQYRGATGRPMRGRTAPAITYGYSKDHRPDLKQLLFILTTEAEDGVPVAFRVADGNTNDAITHIATWNALREVAGRADFLYVADSKLCSHDNLDHIHRAGGRFVTVLPRSRLGCRVSRSGCRPTPRPGSLSGIDPIRGHALARATAGSSSGRRCPQPKAGPWRGCSAACSGCARKHGAGATSPRRPRRSTRCAHGY